MIHRIALDDCPLMDAIIVLDETKYQPKQEFPIYVTTHNDTAATTDSDFTLSWYQLVVTTSSLELSNTLMFLNNELLFILNTENVELTIKKIFSNKIKDHSL